MTPRPTNPLRECAGAIRVGEMPDNGDLAKLPQPIRAEVEKMAAEAADAWSGGSYGHARALAREVVDAFGGQVPDDEPEPDTRTPAEVAESILAHRNVVVGSSRHTFRL